MKKKALSACIVLLLLPLLPSAERTTPLDLHIVIDKSLSMEESGAFSDIKEWLTGTFIDNYLIQGDTVHIYFFYGETKKVYSSTLSGQADFTQLKNAVLESRADGVFTDIGMALDSVKKNSKNSQSSGTKIALILTDLIQEAPYGSKYAGTYYDFAQRYLTGDRIISHMTDGSTSAYSQKGNKPLWYEVTVQIEELKTIEERAQNIYTTIKNTTKEPLYLAQNRNL